MNRLHLAAVLLLGVVLPRPALPDEPPLRQRAAEALRKATDFFTARVSTEGGYLWRYSEDLQ